MDTNDERLKYCFTAYLNVALERERANYVKRIWNEVILVDIDAIVQNENRTFDQDYEEKILEEVNEWFRKGGGRTDNFLNEFDLELRHAVLSLKELEKTILFFRVYLELPFIEIGKILCITSEKAASIYHYARKKLRKRLEKKNGV